jgi:molecular chaperone HscB
MASLNDSHFDLFDLPAQFALDAAVLDHAYRTVQAQVHPDRFAAAGDAQKRIAMQWATRTNEAYQTLRDPLKRATYLLSLRGIDVGAENNTAMEPAFLMQQMEWRESIEDAAAARNVDALDALSSNCATKNACGSTSSARRSTAARTRRRARRYGN